MDDFVAKPVNPEALFAMLAHWLLPAPAQQGPEPAAQASDTGAGAPPLRARADTVELPAAVAGVDGVDWSRGVERMSGDPGKYLRLLRLFADTHADDARSAAALLERGEREALGRLVHALKGAAGSICAQPLLSVTTALDASIRAGAAPAEIERGLAEVTAALDRLTTAIGRAAAPDEPVAARVDLGRLEVVVATLDALLGSGDTQAQQLARNEAALLRAAFGRPADDFLARIASFDYEGAAALLRSLARLSAA